MLTALPTDVGFAGEGCDFPADSNSACFLNWQNKNRWILTQDNYTRHMNMYRLTVVVRKAAAY